MLRMADKIIVLPAAGRSEFGALEKVAAEFGWAVYVAADLADAVAAGKRLEPAALFFHREAVSPADSWTHAIEALRRELPGVPLIACHGFSEPIDWPALSEAGAFHSLWVPLKESEARRSLGFVWQAAKRRAAGIPAVLPEKVRAERMPSIAFPAKPEPTRRMPADRNLPLSKRYLASAVV